LGRDIYSLPKPEENGVKSPRLLGVLTLLSPFPPICREVRAKCCDYPQMPALIGEIMARH